MYGFKVENFKNRYCANLRNRVIQKKLTDEQMEGLAIFYNNLKLGGSTNPPPFTLTKTIELADGLIKDITVHYDEFGFPRFTDHMPAPKRTYAFMKEDYPEGFTQLAATSTDFKHANNKLAEAFGCQKNTDCFNDNFLWDGNTTYFTRKEDGKLVRYTWHHHQDGKSLIAVPSAVNNSGGFSHSGGDKLIKATIPKGKLIDFFSSPTF